MPDDGWEARMSQRAKAREKAERESAPVRRREEYSRRNPALPWLNGWHRASLTTVAIGHSFCIGCGRLLGMACIAIDADADHPPMPEWPFTQDACPVCWGQGSPVSVYSQGEWRDV